MKQYVLVVLFLAAISLVACAAQEEQPTPEVPTPEEGDEPTVPETSPPPSTQEEESAPSEVTQVAPEDAQLDSVICDASTNTITFSFENQGERNWNLDQRAPITGGDEVNVRIFINNYEANRHSPQYHPETREVMFGPETPFSANCGGQEVLMPGQSVECTLSPVLLNRGSGSVDARGVNIIRLDSPARDQTIEFTC